MNPYYVLRQYSEQKRNNGEQNKGPSLSLNSIERTDNASETQMRKVNYKCDRCYEGNKHIGEMESAAIEQG